MADPATITIRHIITGQPVDVETAECDSCHAPIVWTLTRNLKRAPIDALPVADGNVKLYARRGGILSVVLPAALRAREAGPLYRSHFASCKNAASHRKRSRP